jgi:hypothetical protein
VRAWDVGRSGVCVRTSERLLPRRSLMTLGVVWSSTLPVWRANGVATVSSTTAVKTATTMSPITRPLVHTTHPTQQTQQTARHDTTRHDTTRHDTTHP